MDTLGIVESYSIASGVELTDFMMKSADVELVKASTICSGRYLIYVSGDRDCVETSVKTAIESGRRLKGSFVISNISDQVIYALKRRSILDNATISQHSIGVIETKSASSGVAAADACVKQADVNIIRLVTGNGINGKSYYVISGELSCVEEGVDASKNALGKNLVEVVVIPNPDPSVINTLTGVKK